MKKFKKTIAIILFSMIIVSGYANIDIQYTMHLSEARQEYSLAKNNMEKIVYTLHNSGLEGLKKDKKISFSSTFIIDPENGSILLGDAAAESYFHINGKAIVRETIKKWYERMDDNIFEQMAQNQSSMYNVFYSSIAITLSGKFYIVVALLIKKILKNNIFNYNRTWNIIWINLIKL